MAQSDAELNITAKLDSSNAVANMQQMGDKLADSMDKANAASKKLNDNIGDTNKKLSNTVSQLRMASVAMAGMALDIGSSVARSRGYDKTADYMQGAASGMAKGAAVGFALGSVIPGLGNIAGTGIGAVIGAGGGMIKTNYDREAQQKREAEAAAELERKTIAAASDALSKLDQSRASAEEAAEFYKKLGDESLTTAEKSEMLRKRIADFSGAAAELRTQLNSQDLQKNTKAFADVFNEYRQTLAQSDRAKSELDGLPEDDNKSGLSRVSDGLTDMFTRIGAVVGASPSDMHGIDRDILDANKQQVDLLREIRDNATSGGFTAAWA